MGLSIGTKIKQIEEAILKAEAKQSNLDAETLAIGGMTGEKIRHLMNNLGAISKNYFEIGVHRGSLFFSTICGNKNLGTAISCDDFSQFNTDGAEKEFMKRVTKHNLADNRVDPIIFHENRDCFSIEKLDCKPDLYLYDGNHSYRDTKKGITHFAPMMADVFILCMDDYFWPDVMDGTSDGLKESGVKVLMDWRLGAGSESDGSGYWNGYFVALCQK